MPTPVSALLHAATLVTAGLYILIRSTPILEYSSTALLVITLVGATTAFFAATTGLLQNDLKRIIAFSTISQLGYYLLILIFLIFTTYCYFYILHDNLVLLSNILPLYITKFKNKDIILPYIKNKCSCTDLSKNGKIYLKRYKKNLRYLFMG